MTRKKLILGYLEKFFFSLALIIFTCSAILKVTVLNKDFVASKFTTEHYKEVEVDLKEEMKGSMMSSGLDSSIIDDMFTTKDIEDTTMQMLNIVYNFSNKKVDTSNVEEHLRENIKKNLEKKGFNIDNEAAYNEFVTSVMDIYRGEFIMLDQLPKVGKVVQVADKAITILTIVFSLIVFIWMIIRRKRLNRFVPVGLFTTSFFIIFSCLYVNKEAGLTGITIISVTFSKILREVIKSTFTIYYVVAIIYIIIGIMILLLHKYRRRKHHHRH